MIELLGMGFFLLVTGALYVVPLVAAIVKGNKRVPVILAVNLLLGWTVVGWVVALAMVIYGDEFTPEELARMDNEPHLRLSVFEQWVQVLVWCIGLAALGLVVLILWFNTHSFFTMFFKY